MLIYIPNGYIKKIENYKYLYIGNKMSSLHGGFITGYVPTELQSPDLNLVSKRTTEWRDYKFSNGFFWVGFDRGEYKNSEITEMLNRLNIDQIKELLDNLNCIDKELFTLAQKVFTNTASVEEFYKYVEILDNKNVMKYSWIRFNQAQGC